MTGVNQQPALSNIEKQTETYGERKKENKTTQREKEWEYYFLLKLI